MMKPLLIASCVAAVLAPSAAVAQATGAGSGAAANAYGQTLDLGGWLTAGYDGRTAGGAESDRQEADVTVGNRSAQAGGVLA